MFRRPLLATFGLVFAVASSAAANAIGGAQALHFQGGGFEPASLSLPADQPAQIEVFNDWNQTIEFESYELNRERVIQPGKSITVYLRSLSPGTYHFFDDLHHAAGQGTLIVR